MVAVVGAASGLLRKISSVMNKVVVNSTAVTLLRGEARILGLFPPLRQNCARQQKGRSGWMDVVG